MAHPLEEYFNPRSRGDAPKTKRGEPEIFDLSANDFESAIKDEDQGKPSPPKLYLAVQANNPVWYAEGEATSSQPPAGFTQGPPPPPPSFSRNQETKP